MLIICNDCECILHENSFAINSESLAQTVCLKAYVFEKTVRIVLCDASISAIKENFWRGVGIADEWLASAFCLRVGSTPLADRGGRGMTINVGGRC